MSTVVTDDTTKINRPNLGKFQDVAAQPARPANSVLVRWVGIPFGIATQGLFLFTVVHLFLFLRYEPGTFYHGWWGVDAGLATLFVLPHSFLLIPSVQRSMRSYIPGGWLGCIHCSVTCLTLLTVFHFWGHSDRYLWKLTGVAEDVMLVFFYGSWVALLYSLWLTGMGYQTGLTPWWYWATGQKAPVREFVTRGAFRWMRHPVYMSFLGLIWFTPAMSYDHAILTGIWTLYIYAGSYFKDRRLLRYIGKPYSDYAARVTGLPVIGIGSLRKWKSQTG